MSFLYSTAAFIVAIGVIVTVHEFGHFLIARLAGIRVLRFSIGFGPALLKWGRPGGTEYVIAALPLGGYVKMLDERDDEVEESLLALAYNRQPVSKRAAVLLGGPAFNFLFAIIVYCAVFMIGVPGLRPIAGEVIQDSPAAAAGMQSMDRILAVGGKETPTWTSASLALLEAMLDAPRFEVTVESEQGGTRLLQFTVENPKPLTEPGALLPGLGIKEWAPEMPPVIGEIQAGSPAEQAGLLTGDQILESGGSPVKGVANWIEQIQAHPGKPLELLIRRDGETRRVTVTPEKIKTDDGETGRIGAGVGYPPEITKKLFAFERHGPLSAMAKAAKQTLDLSALTLNVLGRMVTGDVSLKNISGPINIASYAGQSAKFGLVPFLSFLAIISISIGVLNLLPVPILDGGRLLFLGAEAIKGAPLSPAAEEIGQRIGLLLLAIFMTLAFYNDIARLMSHGG